MLEVRGVHNPSPPPVCLLFSANTLKIVLFLNSFACIHDDLLKTQNKGRVERLNSFFSKITEKLKGFINRKSPNVPREDMHFWEVDVLNLHVKLVSPSSLQGFAELLPSVGELVQGRPQLSGKGR